MSEPLSVVLCVVSRDGEMLLIERQRGDYQNFWAFPGGKVEQGEHLHEAARREVYEEAGIDSTFDSHVGVVSEHLVTDGDVSEHFLLHICELSAEDGDVEYGAEGEVRWFEIERIAKMSDELVPSDRAMFEQLREGQQIGYYNSVIEIRGDEHVVRQFERP